LNDEDNQKEVKGVGGNIKSRVGLLNAFF